MKKQNLFIIKFLRQYEEQCPGIVEAWCSVDVQNQFNLLRNRNPETPKRRMTCYLLYCMDQRKHLQKQNPYLPNKNITSMLAREWRAHRDANDGIYLFYKNLDARLKFFNDNRSVINKQYPELSPYEVEIILEKLFVKYNERVSACREGVTCGGATPEGSTIRSGDSLPTAAKRPLAAAERLPPSAAPPSTATAKPLPPSGTPAEPSAMTSETSFHDETPPF
jgi:hypothetical protein